jgi:hypothetical protein
VNTNRNNAQESLEIIHQAEISVQRHSLDNGVYLIGWGIIIALALTTFDIFPPQIASAVMTGILFLGSILTVLYARQVKVQIRYPKFVPVMALSMGIYYPIILLGGIALFRHTPHLFLWIASLTAAPLVIAGILRWRHVRKGA